jgi:hypothetical protein
MKRGPRMKTTVVVRTALLAVIRGTTIDRKNMTRGKVR